MQAVEHDGKRILVINLEGVYHALDGICTHEYAELDKSFLLGETLKCHLHLSEFDVVTGEVHTAPASEPLRKYVVKIVDSTIFVEAD